jgi:Bacterial EndoU nuclease
MRHTKLFLLTSICFAQSAFARNFFDNTNNPVAVAFPTSGSADVTPPMPSMSNFDLSLVAICPDSIDPEPSGQRTLLTNLVNSSASSAEKSQLSTAAGGSANLTKLYDAWFARGAFHHVFCGEPKVSGSTVGIDGLHWRGRYVDLQLAGLATLSEQQLSLKNSEVIAGQVYSFPTEGQCRRSASGSREFCSSKLKGYGYGQNGATMLAMGYQAYKKLAPTSSTYKVCYFSQVINTAGDKIYFLTVGNNQGIVTFYPDATPNFSANPKCPGS